MQNFQFFIDAPTQIIQEGIPRTERESWDYTKKYLALFLVAQTVIL